ncbi:MAG: hypothetical protein Q4D05_09275 [Acinetobacter sp.]|nr:hypothetical protein [Acinetobacter sp.]
MLKLYPIVSVILNNDTAPQQIPALWQQTALPSQQTIYGVYSDYEHGHHGNYRFSIATEAPNQETPIIIPDLTAYEIFATSCERIYPTWQHIWQLEQQGTLKRSYAIDFERYYSQEHVEIFVAIQKHD